PIALEADCNLLFSTEMPSFFPSCTASVALVEVLVEQVLARTGSRAISGLEHAETQLQQIDAYRSKDEYTDKQQTRHRQHIEPAAITRITNRDYVHRGIY